MADRSNGPPFRHIQWRERGRYNSLIKEVTPVEDKPVTEKNKEATEDAKPKTEHPMILEEYEIEELSVDGICGVY